MDRLKTLATYVIWIVAFFILSNFLIYVSINATYKNMYRLDTNKNIDIYIAEATYVNGVIKGAVINDTENTLTGKFVKVELYSERDVFLGEKYIELPKENMDEAYLFELNFKVDNVETYKISIVDEKPEVEEFQILPENLTQQQVILSTIVTLLIFWG